MKTNDYVKYITQTVVRYVDQPRNERKKLRQEKKEQRASFMYRWFGIVPFVFMLQLKERKQMKVRSELHDEVK